MTPASRGSHLLNCFRRLKTQTGLSACRHTTYVLRNSYSTFRTGITSTSTVCFSNLRKHRYRYLSSFLKERHPSHLSSRRSNLHLTSTVTMADEASSLGTGQRSICFADYDLLGFDVDHTLAKYNLPNLFNLAYGALADYLVEHKGYEKSLQDSFDIDFNTRGLVFHEEKGNFLKLADDGTIMRASHGTKMLTRKEIQEYYGDNTHWDKFEELVDKVTNIDGHRIFENFFDMPGTVIFARIVDQLDQKAGKRLEKYSFVADVLEAYNYIYRYQCFQENTGGFFNVYKQDISKYVHPCSEEVKQWLKRLRKTKKLFIITSSFADFALATIEQALGAKWEDYFDMCITWARKPSFFTSDRPFKKSDGIQELEDTDVIEWGQLYSQGNHGVLMKFFKEQTGKDSPKVLYFGDSLRSDVFPSKTLGDWDTVMILEEIVAETHSEDEAPDAKRLKYQCPTEEEKEYLTSSQWGSFFCDAHPLRPSDTPSSLNTLWGYMVRKYADVAVPQLEYMTEIPLDHQYQVFSHKDAGQWGFYPMVPKALEAANNSEK